MGKKNEREVGGVGNEVVLEEREKWRVSRVGEVKRKRKKNNKII